MSWHMHRWSPWEPYDQPEFNILNGQQWVAPYQRRRCERCGKQKSARR